MPHRLPRAEHWPRGGESPREDRRRERRCHHTVEHKTLRMLAILGAISLGTVGCAGNNVPCDTQPDQIESAADELAQAEQQLASAKDDLAKAKAEKTELASELENMPEVNELERKLYILKKGSGR